MDKLFCSLARAHAITNYRLCRDPASVEEMKNHGILDSLLQTLEAFPSNEHVEKTVGKTIAKILIDSVDDLITQLKVLFVNMFTLKLPAQTPTAAPQNYHTHTHTLKVGRLERGRAREGNLVAGRLGAGFFHGWRYDCKKGRGGRDRQLI